MRWDEVCWPPPVRQTGPSVGVYFYLHTTAVGADRGRWRRGGGGDWLWEFSHSCRPGCLFRFYNIETDTKHKDQTRACPHRRRSFQVKGCTASQLNGEMRTIKKKRKENKDQKSVLLQCCNSCQNWVGSLTCTLDPKTQTPSWQLNFLTLTWTPLNIELCSILSIQFTSRTFSRVQKQNNQWKCNFSKAMLSVMLCTLLSEMSRPAAKAEPPPEPDFPLCSSW